MNCETYQDLVAAHVDGCLSPDERNEAERHFASCTTCSQLFSHAQQFQSAFAARMLNARTLNARTFIVPVPEAVEQQLRSALSAETELQPAFWERMRARFAYPPGRSRLPRLAWGTALASFFVAIALFQLLNSDSSSRLLTTVTSYYSAVVKGHVALTYTTNTVQQLQESFNQSGQLDFSTHVPDLQPAGYQLRGGTVAAVQGRPMAVAYYAGLESDTQPIVCLRQRGSMPSPGFGARRVSADVYLYDQDGYAVLVSQFSGHFCTLVSRLPGDVFLERLGMHKAAW